MGVLHYGYSFHPIEVDDRLLGHLRFVILDQLRRGDGLALTIDHSHPYGPQHTTVWIHPSIPLRFEFDSSIPEPELDHTLTRAIAAAATTPQGIIIQDGELTQGGEPTATDQ